MILTRVTPDGQFGSAHVGSETQKSRGSKWSARDRDDSYRRDLLFGLEQVPAR